MKCYLDRAYTDICEEISLGAALRLIADYHTAGAEFTWVDAANMLQLSSHSRTVPVDGGAVWVSDDVPVLDFDKVVNGWWHLHHTRVSGIWPEKRLSCVILCSVDYEGKAKVEYQFRTNYEDETKGLNSERCFSEHLRRIGWVQDDIILARNERLLLGDDHGTTTPQSKDTLQHGGDADL